MKLKFLFILLLAPLLLFADAGNIVAVKGDANIKRDNKLIKATINMAIENGDTIITGNQSRLQVRFKDNTVITVGKNSDFTITDFEYSSKNKKKNKFSARFGNGLFKSITGAIGKLNPEKFRLKTKSATIGIRGTTVFIESLPLQADIIACISGEIAVTAINTNIEVIVPAGKITRVVMGTAPTTPRIYKDKEVNKFQKPKNTVKTEKQKTIVVEEQEEEVSKEQEEIQVEDDSTIDTVVDNITETEEVIVDAIKNVDTTINPLSDLPSIPVLY